MITAAEAEAEAEARADAAARLVLNSAIATRVRRAMRALDRQLTALIREEIALWDDHERNGFLRPPKYSPPGWIRYQWHRRQIEALERLVRPQEQWYAEEAAAAAATAARQFAVVDAATAKAVQDALALSTLHRTNAADVLAQTRIICQPAARNQFEVLGRQLEAGSSKSSLT